MQRFFYPTLLTACLLVLLQSCSARAQDAIAALESNETTTTTAEPSAFNVAITNLETAKTTEAIQDAIAELEEIATAEDEGKWLTQYYIGYGYGKLAFAEQNLKLVDGWCEMAITALNLAQERGGTPDEISTAYAFISYAGIKVNVMERGFTHSRQAMQKLQEAMAVNPSNPRAILLMAQHYLNTPVQFGGDKEKGCDLNSRAMTNFAKESDVSAEVSPKWGHSDSIDVQANICGSPSSDTKK